jgi:hypothetical protein
VLERHAEELICPLKRGRESASGKLLIMKSILSGVLKREEAWE